MLFYQENGLLTQLCNNMDMPKSWSALADDLQQVINTLKERFYITHENLVSNTQIIGHKKLSELITKWNGSYDISTDYNKLFREEGEKLDMLEKIRLDRPDLVINEVIAVKQNKLGFYDVRVDMESMFFDTIIKHSRVTLPYPYSDYEKLSDIEREEWSDNNY